MKLMTKRPAFWVTGRDVHYTTAKGSAASLCLGAGVKYASDCTPFGKRSYTVAQVTGR
jgi:hypothetical protein